MYWVLRVEYILDTPGWIYTGYFGLNIYWILQVEYILDTPGWIYTGYSGLPGLVAPDWKDNPGVFPVYTLHTA